jgi:hypothetical protein
MTDHTDPGHVTGSHERTSRSTTRVGDSGSPVGSPLTIVLALIAVAVGFLIFRSISDNDDAAGGGVLPDTPTTLSTGVTAPGQTTAAPAGATTTPTTISSERITEGGTIIVANASRADGAAGLLTELIAAEGYTTGEATDDNSDEARDETVVYFTAGNNTEAVAQSLARDLGGVEVLAMPAEIPTASGELSGNILVLLGSDIAGDDELPGPPPQAPAAPSIATTTTTA